MKEFKGTKGKWSSGTIYGVVISDQATKRPTYDDRDYESEMEYYGGYLICESIPTPEDSILIAAAPELLEALQELHDLLEENEPNWYLVRHHNKAEKAINKALGL